MVGFNQPVNRRRQGLSEKRTEAGEQETSELEIPREASDHLVGVAAAVAVDGFPS